MGIHLTGSTPKAFALACLPDLFARPLARPLRRHPPVPRRRVGGRTKLDQVLNLEPVGAEETNPITVAEVELDRPVGPIDPMHPEVWAFKPLADGRLVVGAVGCTEQRQQAVDEEDQLTAWSENPGRLGDPGVGIAPDARAVLADREIKGGVGIGRLLGVAEVQREVQTMFRLESPRGRELIGGVVDPGRSRPAPGEPGGDVGRAAAQLDGIASREIGRKQVNPGLRDGEDTPGRVVRRPGALA